MHWESKISGKGYHELVIESARKTTDETFIIRLVLFSPVIFYFGQVRFDEETPHPDDDSFSRTAVPS